MAKIVPQGYADIQQYDETDDYFKVLDYLTNIGNTYREVKQEHENSQIQAMTTAGSLVAGANSPEQLTLVKNSINSIIDENYISDNPQYNLLKDTLDMTIDDKTSKVTQISNQSAEFARILSSTENQFGTPIMDMTGEQLKSHYDSLGGNQEGWIVGLGKEREKLIAYANLIGQTYGDKNPNYKFQYVDANGAKQTMSLMEVQRMISKYDNQMNALIFSALDDRVLSEQEAMTLASMGPGQGLEYFQGIRQGKIANFQAMYNRSTKGYNTVISKINQLIKSGDETNPVIGAIPPDILPSIQGMAQSEFLETNYPPNLGTFEGLSDEEKYSKLVNDITSGALTKDTMAQLLNAMAVESGDMRTQAEQGLRAWGGADFFEFKMPAADDADEVVKILNQQQAGDEETLVPDDEETSGAKPVVPKPTTAFSDNLALYVEKHGEEPHWINQDNNIYWEDIVDNEGEPTGGRQLKPRYLKIQKAKDLDFQNRDAKLVLVSSDGEMIEEYAKKGDFTNIGNNKVMVIPTVFDGKSLGIEDAYAKAVESGEAIDAGKRNPESWIGDNPTYSSSNWVTPENFKYPEDWDGYANSPALQSAATEPVGAVTTEPVTTEPATTEPITTEPITTEPITTEPVTTEPPATEPVTPAQDDTSSDETGSIMGFLNEYKDEAAVGTLTTAYAIKKIPEIKNFTLESTKYLRDVIGLDSDTIYRMFNDPQVEEFVDVMRDNTKQIRQLEKSLPKDMTLEKLKKTGSSPFLPDGKTPNPQHAKFKQYLRLLKNRAEIREVAVENLRKIKYLKDVPKEKLHRMLDNQKKWNLFKVKSSAARIIKETVETPKDLLRVLTAQGYRVGPLEGALLGWYAGEELGLNWYGQMATAAGGTWTMKKILDAIKARGGAQQALTNPVLRSKIGKYLVKKAPGMAAKLGIKTTAGAIGTLAPTGISQVAGIAMLAWTANDVMNLIKDFPEIKQMFQDYLEGYYDDGEDRSGERWDSDIIKVNTGGDVVEGAISTAEMITIARKKPKQIFEIDGSFYQYDNQNSKLISYGF